MINLKKKKFIKHLLIIIIFSIQSYPIKYLLVKKYCNIFLLVNTFVYLSFFQTKFHNLFFKYYENKFFLFYKICLQYLHLKNKLWNNKILIKRKFYKVKSTKKQWKKKEKIKKTTSNWLFQFKYFKIFKLKFWRLKKITNLHSLKLNQYNLNTIKNQKFFSFSNNFFFKKKIQIWNKNKIFLKIKKNLFLSDKYFAKKIKFNRKQKINNNVLNVKNFLIFKKNTNKLKKTCKNFFNFIFFKNKFYLNNNVYFFHFYYLFNFYKIFNLFLIYKASNLLCLFNLDYKTRLFLYKLTYSQTSKQNNFFLFCKIFIINFYEMFFKTKIFLKIYKNISITNSLLLLFNFFSKKFKKIQQYIGKGFFLKEMFYVIFSALKYKDIVLLKNWLIKNLERMSFTKHKKFFYFLKLIIKNLFPKVNKFFNIKGFYMDITGKISVSGDAQTRRYIISYGFSSFSSLTYKLSYTKFIVRTTTGVLGLSLSISYR